MLTLSRRANRFERISTAYCATPADEVCLAA
jgi:hypothetical protein